MIKPIPTMYRGVMMRSRLEARWAAFFDSVEWPWAYEPIDLDWYIPDFVLTFDAGPIVVEVKPEIEIPALEGYAQRMTQSGWHGELLVLGAVLHGDIIGINSEPFTHDGRTEMATGPAEAFRCISCGRISIKSVDLSYRCRVSGCYDGDHYVGQLEHGELAGLWAAAGNRVQWKGPPTLSPRDVR